MLAPFVLAGATPAKPALDSLRRSSSVRRSSSLRWQIFCGLLLALSTLTLSSCKANYYKFPEYTYAGRPIPPSKLAERVMISVTVNGSSGDLQIVDALRDIRSNVENTISSFSIRGYSSGYPISIMNFPAETRGYVYSTSDGSLTNVNYSTESSSGSAGTFQSGAGAVAVPQAFTHYYGAEESVGVLEVIDNGVGVPPGMMSHMFELFHSTKGNRGTGLGLAVAKKIIDEHDGSIAVKSRQGVGTTFTIRLPVTSANMSDPSHTHGPAK